MNNRRTPAFRRLFAALPEDMKARAVEAFQEFVANPRSPGLNLTKIVAPAKSNWPNPCFSVRIARQYRAVYVVHGNTNVWFWIGHKKDYASILGSR